MVATVTSYERFTLLKRKRDERTIVDEFSRLSLNLAILNSHLAHCKRALSEQSILYGHLASTIEAGARVASECQAAMDSDDLDQLICCRDKLVARVSKE
jgi:hypothetical protein